MNEKDLIIIAKKLLGYNFSDCKAYKDLTDFEKLVIKDEEIYIQLLDWIGLGPQIAS